MYVRNEASIIVSFRLVAPPVTSPVAEHPVLLRAVEKANIPRDYSAVATSVYVLYITARSS